MIVRNIITGIVFATTTAAALAQQGDAARGQKVFETCRACHADDGKTNEIGPGLYGVFERKAGQRDDFRYSPAMKKSGVAWTPQTLDTFLADPQSFVPANRMPFAGLPDPRE